MKIAFLIHNAYGIGGTIRATFNLAGALVARHEVEVVSVYRSVDTPHLPVSPKVRITPLIDLRKDAPGCDADDELQHQPSSRLPDPEGSLRVFTRLADLRVAQYLAATDADVVIATRPGLLVYLAEADADRPFLRIGQEHMTYSSHVPAVRAAHDAVIPKMHAFLTVTEQDAATHREHLPESKLGATVLRCLPNVVPTPKTEPSDGASKVIVAAGRLDEAKRFDLLVRAFSQLADEYPDWSLRIYGRGPDRARLRALIDELGLSDRAYLMGPRSPIETEWAKAAVAVSASDAESFGLTIVEAMHCGVPVISTDCPIGPREIIEDGADGILIPVGDEAALVASIRKLIDSPELRRTLGAAARASAQRYAPQHIAVRFEELVRELRPALVPEPPAPPAPASPLPNLGLRRAAARLVRPLRRKSEPAAKAAPPASAAPKAPLKPLRPKASARVTPDGGLSVRIPRGGATGERLALVGRLRGTDGKAAGERVSVPLEAPASGKGPLTATLDRTSTRLAEGRWDFRVERADDGKRARVAAALVEQARLLTLPLVTDADGDVTAWVPYTTAAGSLTLRTWRRPYHAELDRIVTGPDSVTLTATVHGRTGPLPTDGTAAVFALSPEDDMYDVAVAVTVLDERRFECTLPYERLLTRRGTSHDTWELRLRLPGDGPATAVRLALGRLAGDNVDRKRTDVGPARELSHPLRGTVAVKPVFDPANDLTIDVKDVTLATY
ncbi:glycosyltransferase family 4 protein [Streptomyces sp. NPDC050617]|uniref:glycosyltransferase family 4 protein n=1 Tax=Streptomyces sp. NPDC050617 TaxID=3154628 RepID=UPI0034494B32